MSTSTNHVPQKAK